MDVPTKVCVFTTPAYEWASSFRRSAPNERDDLAYFELSDGRSAHVPSIILPTAAQCSLIEHAGLRLIDISTITVAQTRPLSKNTRPRNAWCDCHRLYGA